MTSHVFRRDDGGAAQGFDAPDVSSAVNDARRLARVRWRCRRGMLENDLVLARFLAQRGDALTEDDVAMLDRLLELPDNELWDLISRRSEPGDAFVAPLLEALRT